MPDKILVSTHALNEVLEAINMGPVAVERLRDPDLANNPVLMLQDEYRQATTICMKAWTFIGEKNLVHVLRDGLPPTVKTSEADTTRVPRTYWDNLGLAFNEARKSQVPGARWANQKVCLLEITVRVDLELELVYHTLKRHVAADAIKLVATLESIN